MWAIWDRFSECLFMGKANAGLDNYVPVFFSKRAANRVRPKSWENIGGKRTPRYEVIPVEIVDMKPADAGGKEK